MVARVGLMGSSGENTQIGHEYDLNLHYELDLGHKLNMAYFVTELCKGYSA